MVYYYYCLLSKILVLCVPCSLFSHLSSQQFPRFPLFLISPPPPPLHHLAIASHGFQAEARTIDLLKKYPWIHRKNIISGYLNHHCHISQRRQPWDQEPQTFQLDEHQPDFQDEQHDNDQITKDRESSVDEVGSRHPRVAEHVHVRTEDPADLYY